MPEREQPNLDRVRDALREHDERQESEQPAEENQPPHEEETGEGEAEEP
jgi:hypothetical protein